MAKVAWRRPPPGPPLNLCPPLFPFLGRGGRRGGSVLRGLRPLQAPFPPRGPPCCHLPPPCRLSGPLRAPALVGCPGQSCSPASRPEERSYVPTNLLFRRPVHAACPKLPLKGPCQNTWSLSLFSPYPLPHLIFKDKSKTTKQLY